MSGSLDDGRPLECGGMFATESQFGTSGTGAMLFANRPVAIGMYGKGPVSRGEYPLLNYFDGQANLEDDGWVVTIDDTNSDATKEARRVAKLWKVPEEGMMLTLANPEADPSEYEEKAREVMLLLSIARGTGVTCRRQSVAWCDGSQLETLGHWTGDEIGPGECVPSFEIQPFLQCSMPNWRGWSDKKRTRARLAIGCINLSARGYLDNRLMGIAQAWEFLSTDWGPKRKLSDVEKALKKRLKLAYGEWQKDHPGTDDDHRLWNRIASAFQWPAAIAQMEAFAANRGLDVGKIGLDFRALMEARNAVAHDGSLPDDMLADKGPTVDLLRAAQFGLQLALLSELGYTRQVATAIGGSTTWKPIGDYVTR